MIERRIKQMIDISCDGKDCNNTFLVSRSTYTQEALRGDFYGWTMIIPDYTPHKPQKIFNNSYIKHYCPKCNIQIKEEING